MPRITPSHRIRRFFRTKDSAFHPQSVNYKWWLLANVMIGTFMAVLDATIVNVGLPKIMASFGVGLDKIEWVITAYMLALAVMLPASAWMADKFGYKRMYFWGLLLFTFGSFLCGVSNDENMLIISRVIQGFGAGAIQPIGMAIIIREFPPNKRGVALGFWAISAAASVSFGPLIGGYLVDHFNWQLIFDINVPIGILGMLATVIIQREYKNKKVKGFDLVGFISAAIFLPLILYALSQGNAATNSAGWRAPYILVCFAVAAIAFVVFIVNEYNINNPLMELRLFANHNFGLGSLIIFIFGIGMFGSTFLLPIYLQNSMGYTALQAGSIFLPVGIIQGIMSPIAGKLSDKINAKIPIIIGIVFFSFSFYLNTKFSFLTSRSFVMTTLYIRGFAMGLMFTSLSNVSLFEIKRENLAQASSLTNILRQLGGSFGVAILATILTTRSNYHSQIYSESLQSVSPIYRQVTANYSNYITQHTGSAKDKAIIQSQFAILSNVRTQAFIQGVDDDFLVACVITLLGGIPVFFLHTRRKKTVENKITYE